jgi:predicted nucleic acid-binding Zn ribbon protein
VTRRLPPLPEPDVPYKSEPRRVGESLDRVARKLGGPDAATLHTLIVRWSEIVGAQIADHARPTSLREGVLTVAVDDPAWRTQLVFLEQQMRTRVRDATGLEVVRVEVRIRRK